MFWKASVLEKTEGNKGFSLIAKLKVIPGKPSVLCYKKSKQKENRTEGNKGTPKYPIQKCSDFNTTKKPINRSYVLHS